MPDFGLVSCHFLKKILKQSRRTSVYVVVIRNDNRGRLSRGLYDIGLRECRNSS